MVSLQRSRRAVASLLPILGCSSGDSPGVAPAFPESYPASYVEVRDCRLSADHELSPVRVFADPTSANAYINRDRPFEEGTLLVKAEYDSSDRTCTGEVLRWTVMARRATESTPDTLDWYWQEVDAGRIVVSENDTRCVGCHTGCGAPPDGYLGTCSIGASFGSP